MFGGGFRGFSGGFPFGGMGEEESSQSQGEIDNKSLYELIGVAPKSTTDEVKKAFRKKAVKEHPDKGGDPEKFKKLTEAYEMISNPEKKDLYDRFGMEGVKNGGGQGDMGDIFSHFFGGGGGRRDQGPKKMRAKMRGKNSSIRRCL